MNLAVAALAMIVVLQSPVPATPPAASAAAARPAAPAPPLAPKTELAIKARAVEWWTARARREHQRMYDLFEPSYRKQVPFAEFLKESVVRSRFDLSNPQVVTVVPESADRVRVSVSIDTQPPGLPAGHVTAEDVWVKVSGQWFKVHQTPATFPVSR